MSPTTDQHEPNRHEPQVGPPDPFETALAALRPCGNRLDHDVVMYQAGWRAGRAATRRGTSVASWSRTVLTSAVSAVAAGLLVGIFLQPGPTVVRQEEKPSVDSREGSPENRLEPQGNALAFAPGPARDASEDVRRRLLTEERWRRQMQRHGVDLNAPPRGLTFQGPVHQPRTLSQYELMREFARQAANEVEPG